MTKHELQQVRDLDIELRILRRHLTELEAMIGSGGGILGDGQPKGNKIGRPTEEQAVNLADTFAKIREHERRLQIEKDRVWSFITSINDTEIRQIIILRFIDGKSWFKVALGLGGDHTEDGCRMAFNRFMDALDNDY